MTRSEEQTRKEIIDRRLKLAGWDVCPCGSGEKLRKCHGTCIYNIVTDDRFRQYDFMQDFLQIAVYLKKDGVISDFREYHSTKVQKYIKETKKNPKQKWEY